eukprot:2349187-Rhodomonas_salina.2
MAVGEERGLGCVCVREGVRCATSGTELASGQQQVVLDLVWSVRSSTERAYGTDRLCGRQWSRVCQSWYVLVQIKYFPPLSQYKPYQGRDAVSLIPPTLYAAAICLRPRYAIARPLMLAVSYRGPYTAQRVPPYASPTPCPCEVLRLCYAATRPPVKEAQDLIRETGTDPPMLLRAPYAMSGTETGSYALSKCPVLGRLCCYARPTRCPVLRQAMLLPGLLELVMQVRTVRGAVCTRGGRDAVETIKQCTAEAVLDAITC